MTHDPHDPQEPIELTAWSRTHVADLLARAGRDDTGPLTVRFAPTDGSASGPNGGKCSRCRRRRSGALVVIVGCGKAVVVFELCAPCGSLERSA